MSKKKLFDDDSDDDIALKTENEYAKKYDTWREKEEIHKLEQKYGPDALKSDGSQSSDSEDDSDDLPEVSEEVEEQFLKTLALLKTKDPRIYDPSFKCFEEKEQKKLEEKTKPKTLTFDDSDDDDGGDIFQIEKKAEIDENDAHSPDSGEANKKKKGKKIKEYLTGEAEHVDKEVEKDLAPLRALWSDPKLTEGEAFLRDYILNKRYLEEGDAGEGADRLRDDADLEADEQTVEEQNKFERAYNFRFEEPDDEYLKRFPRTLSSTRPKDERRSRKRAELRARKDDDKRRKMDEIGRLKALKLKEIQQKIARLKEVTGNDQLAFEEEDIEGDFDPAEHDRRMRALFDEQYYGDADNEKPVFPDLDEELEIENWDKYDVDAEPKQTRGNDETHCEDDDFNMDADYDPSQPRANLLAEIQKTLGKKRRNRKRKSKLAEVLSVEKPKFLPEDRKSYDQYMEEYYKMDCEDIIGGDLPTRFKYRQVVPNDYGLTVEEILLADDRELTQWVPLKRIVKHRPENVEKGEVKTYAQKAADLRLKKKMLPSLFRDIPEEPEIVVPVEEGTKKKKKKKKKNKEYGADVEKSTDNLPDGAEVAQETNGEEESEVKRKKKKKGKKNTATEENDCGALEQANEIQIEVKEKKKKKSIVESSTEDRLTDNDVTNEEIDTSKEVRSKKKKKQKTSEDIDSESNNIEEVVDKIAVMSRKSNKKKRKNSQITGDANDSSVNSNVDGQFDNLGENKKKKQGDFVVEEVSTQGPSQQSQKIFNGLKKTSSEISPGKGVKRKSETHGDSNQHKKKKHENANDKKGKKDKKKFNQKDKFKKKSFNDKQGKGALSDNQLTNLSDERLKAYGLNPKKYKNFLKYKKF